MSQRTKLDAALARGELRVRLHALGVPEAAIETWIAYARGNGMPATMREIRTNATLVGTATSEARERFLRALGL